MKKKKVFFTSAPIEELLRYCDTQAGEVIEVSGRAFRLIGGDYRSDVLAYEPHLEEVVVEPAEDPADQLVFANEAAPDEDPDFVDRVIKFEEVRRDPVVALTKTRLSVAVVFFNADTSPKLEAWRQNCEPFFGRDLTLNEVFEYFVAPVLVRSNRLTTGEAQIAQLVVDFGSIDDLLNFVRVYPRVKQAYAEAVAERLH